MGPRGQTSATPAVKNTAPMSDSAIHQPPSAIPVMMRTKPTRPRVQRPAVDPKNLIIAMNVLQNVSEGMSQYTPGGINATGMIGL
jgi:hypothetical protein